MFSVDVNEMLTSGTNPCLAAMKMKCLDNRSVGLNPSLSKKSEIERHISGMNPMLTEID